jgi:AraC-like DNA-binding protein
MRDPLSQILNALRLSGTIYFHTDFTPPWGVRVPAYRNVARFHFVIRGRCFIRVEGCAEAWPLAAGDLVVIPHGTAHILSDTPDREAIDVDDVIAMTGYRGRSALVYGGKPEGAARDAATQLFCGHFEFAEGMGHPVFDALPRLIHLSHAETRNAAWFEPVMQFVVTEVRGGFAGADAIAHRLTEIVFIQVIRRFVDRAGETIGPLAGILDPQLGRALSAVHAMPQEDWTVASMAREAGLSRTLFAERFAKLMGMTPLGYVTQWRLNLARRRLVEAGLPVIQIAEETGYRSEAAFGRAFKRHFGVTPGQFRQKRG